MDPEPEPAVVELAPLPREKLGPFLLLGLDKEAGPKQIEAHWARRLIGARQHLIPLSLEDVNWAREILKDTRQRTQADCASFNLDIGEALLKGLSQRFGIAAAGVGFLPKWSPLDTEKPLAGYSPWKNLPDLDQERLALEVPEIPVEVPAVSRFLEESTRRALDPWELEIP
jgi:hypothetical protein